ncbi:hypothetical protein ACFVWT_08665 [Arthrobacter sp. NPDC058288]|uniref:hypothetical protein n=1 Tax=Arthrobacter sp. NPDC058288 TaxID=3346424 RepID=UPI0036E4AFE2
MVLKGIPLLADALNFLSKGVAVSDRVRSHAELAELGRPSISGKVHGLVVAVDIDSDDTTTPLWMIYARWQRSRFANLFIEVAAS